jgi:hypothetical protein
MMTMMMVALALPQVDSDRAAREPRSACAGVRRTTTSAGDYAGGSSVAASQAGLT